LAVLACPVQCHSGGFTDSPDRSKVRFGLDQSIVLNFEEFIMRRFLLTACVMGALMAAGAGAANAGTPVHFVDWNHHHHVVVDRCYPPVQYARPEVVYYPQVIAAPPVVAAPPLFVAPPAGFVSLSGRHFGIRFGF
jgi:hypothetical protein